MKLFLVLVFLITGCASRSYQTEALLKERESLPIKSRVADVPFIRQKKNHCGPATLAMILQHQKKNTDVNVLASQMMTPLKNGTFQTDMISSARRNGMLAIEVNNLKNLLKEIADGNPVIVFQNLGLEKVPKWHYALATGYNLKKPEIILHSGDKQNLKMDLRVFEHTWRLAEFWGLLILNPGELSSTANDLSHTSAAAGLEALDNLEAAEISYLSILERWPSSLAAHIGMGNIRYRQGRFSEAVVYLKAATIKHPSSSIAWHNLAIAQGASRMFKDAAISSKKALSLVSSDQKTKYEESLREWMTN